MSRVLAWAWVPGQPRTKGSLDLRRGGGMTDSAASRRWRSQIVQTVRVARSGSPSAPNVSMAAISVEALCFVPESAAEAIDSGSGAGLATEAAIRESPTNGDLDKLARNLLDALAVDLVHNDQRKGADVYRNDCQVTDIRFRKLVALPEYGVGILFRVIELDPIQVMVARQLSSSTLWCAEHGFLPDGELVPWVAG
jgi:Holliday junction resolvase RusA-like endonuclease